MPLLHAVEKDAERPVHATSGCRTIGLCEEVTTLHHMPLLHAVEKDAERPVHATSGCRTIGLCEEVTTLHHMPLLHAVEKDAERPVHATSGCRTIGLWAARKLWKQWRNRERRRGEREKANTPLSPGKRKSEGSTSYSWAGLSITPDWTVFCNRSTGLDRLGRTGCLLPNGAIWLGLGPRDRLCKRPPQLIAALAFTDRCNQDCPETRSARSWRSRTFTTTDGISTSPVPVPPPPIHDRETGMSQYDFL
ncbi:hypothetical protein J6590_024574 [Homalodisca vitripennis]|nr:hypothetical protein J6590_024574 [Homalodisca vitripennis]